MQTGEVLSWRIKNLSCVIYLHDRMGVVCLNELSRWRVTFRGRMSHHPCWKWWFMHHFNPHFTPIFQVELTASYEPTPTNRLAFYPLCCWACRESVKSGIGESLPPLGIFISQACRKLIVWLGAWRRRGSGGWNPWKFLSQIWTLLGKVEVDLLALRQNTHDLFMHHGWDRCSSLSLPSVLSLLFIEADIRAW